MLAELNEEQAAIYETARRFTKDKITPHAADWDQNYTFPRATIREAAALGFGAIYVSEEHGGIGLGRLEATLIVEAMAYGCPSTSAFISIHNMASWMIDSFGSAEVRSRFLPKLVTMENMASYCLTEPAAGSDAAALRSEARRDGDHYVINGTKAFISGGGENEIYLCMLRTSNDGPRGISCILVEKGTPGLSFGAQERKLGWHSQPTAMVQFDDCRVPVENRVGAEGQGFKIAMSGLDGGRLNIAACSLGGANRCLDEAIAYVRERHQFGQAIAAFQNTQFKIAEMATKLAASQALLHLAARKVTTQAADKTTSAAMAKLFTTEACSEVVNQALQLHGGYGYLMDYPIERFLRDLRVHEILEGTNEIMRMIIGRELLR